MSAEVLVRYQAWGVYHVARPVATRFVGEDMLIYRYATGPV